MSKTIHLPDATRAKIALAHAQAVHAARLRVIQLKRRLCAEGRTVAYTDGHFWSPAEGRTDRYGK